MGLSYAQVGKLFGFAKSTLCKWIRREKLTEASVDGEVLEMDGLWTRTAEGSVEMKVIRDERGNAMATFDSWEVAVNEAYMRGAASPTHIVSDGGPRDSVSDRYDLWRRGQPSAMSVPPAERVHQEHRRGGFWRSAETVEV